MDSRKLELEGSKRTPIGTLVADQPKDEIIGVSIILKPKMRAIVPEGGGASVSREEFAGGHGANAGAIDKVRQFAAEYELKIVEAASRRTVRLDGTAANIARAFEVAFDRYEYDGHQYRPHTGGINVLSELAPSVEAVLGLDHRPQASQASLSGA